MPRPEGWTRDQLLLALRLYLQLPFGKLHRLNPEIISLANRIGRSPNALAMKACNFATLDPALRARGVRGLPNLSNADRDIWAEFASNSEALAAEAEQAASRIDDNASKDRAASGPSQAWADETEIERIIRARRVQSFFRSAVLTSYNHSCAISGLAVPELLNASHIIPWSVSVERRADPTNGLCLNALFDRAFDRGLITISHEMTIQVSPRLLADAITAEIRCSINEIEGRRLRLPLRFTPDPNAMLYHRTHVFKG
jgi:putative restriction endonuclease